MPGAGAQKRHKKERSDRVEHMYRDAEGVWHPKAGLTRRAAQRAVERIYEMTLHQYIKYECRVCHEFHLKPHSSRWRASVLVQMLEEGSG